MFSFSSCPENYLGDYCQYENPCFAGGRKCQNGGSCRVLESPDRVPTFKCECPIGYTASFCEIEVQHIKILNVTNRKYMILQKGVRLFIYFINLFLKKKWYMFKHYELQVKENACASSINPCSNGATCILQASLSNYTCVCSLGWKGKSIIKRNVFMSLVYIPFVTWHIAQLCWNHVKSA